MPKSFVLALFLLPAAVTAQSGFGGKGASFTIELKGLSTNDGILSASGTIKNSEFSAGLYFEPKNKVINLEVPKNCHSLAELAFAGSLKFTVRGELKKFTENYVSPNEASFNERLQSVAELNVLSSESSFFSRLSVE